MNRLRYFAGAASGFREIIRAPRLHSADTLIGTHLARRHENFLELVRRVVFANAAHPYRQMFAIAGCSNDDLAAAVRRDGLEATLASLHRSGVYLTHDEFKLKSRSSVGTGRSRPMPAASAIRSPPGNWSGSAAAAAVQGPLSPSARRRACIARPTTSSRSTNST